MPCEDGEPTRMNFPQVNNLTLTLMFISKRCLNSKLLSSHHSQNLETTTKKKGKRVNTGSGASNR